MLQARTEARLYIITDTNDTTKITSLRGAIIAANHERGKNTIILGQTRDFRDHARHWVYPLTIAGVDESNAFTGDLNITRGDLSILGMSPDVVIDATGLGDRVFNVSSNAQLTLENLKITGGTAPVGSGFFADGEFGGGIFNSGCLILRDCVISNNLSGGGQFVEGNAGGTGGGDGGGIYNDGILQIENCAIVGNACGGGIDDGFGGNGGGIRNNGYCILTDSIISGNRSGSGGPPEGNFNGLGGSGGNGGGIFNSGIMILNSCNMDDNTASQGANGGDPSLGTFFTPGGPGGNGGNGGGIYNIGKLTIMFSAIYDNNTGNGGNGATFESGGNAGSGGSGGGIFNAGTLELNTSTVSGNSCGRGGDGGGGAVTGASGGSGGGGGGIYNSGLNAFLGLTAGSLSLTSSTITLDTCGTGGNGGNSGGPLASDSAASGGGGGDGGGILNNANSNAVMIRNTLIAQNLANLGGVGGTNTLDILNLTDGLQFAQQIGNSGADGIGFDIAGDFTSRGFNLISTGDGSTGFVNGVNADKVGSDANPIDPMIGPLQMNGGFTPTHALLWGSPAIDQGNCFGVHLDQRGRYRPYIYRSIAKPPGGDGSDIGAFELDVRMN